MPRVMLGVGVRMGALFKVLEVMVVLVLVVAEASVLGLGAQQQRRSSAPQWGRVATEFLNMNVVCLQCDELCPMAPYITPEEGRKAAELHRACYMGCSATCLLQMGPDKFDYDVSKTMCIKGCRDEYHTTLQNENVFSRTCIEACSGKVVHKINPAELTRTYAQLDLADETKTVLFDPSLEMRRGGLPRSTYKTIPRKDSLVVYSSTGKQLPTDCTLYLRSFCRFGPYSDLVALVLTWLLLLIFLMFYLIYMVRLVKRGKNKFILVGTESSAPLLPSNFIEDDYVPPSSPPPKYSDIVQTV